MATALESLLENQQEYQQEVPEGSALASILSPEAENVIVQDPNIPDPVGQSYSPAEVVPKDPNSASSIVGRSVDQMQASLGGALETVGEITDSEYLQDVGSEYRKEQLAEAAQYGAPAISSYKQVQWDDAESVGSFLKQMGLGAAPSLAVGISGTVGGAAAGSKAGGARGAVVGGVLGAITSSLPLNVGEVQNAIKEIDPEAKSPWSSVLGGSAMSSLDVVGLTSIAKPLVKMFGKDIAYQALVEQGVMKEAAVQAVKGAGIESVTEAAQTGISAVAAAEGTDTNVNTEKLIEDAINSAVGGFMAGGAMGGASGAYGAASQNQMVAGTATPIETPDPTKAKPRNFAERFWDTLGSESTRLVEPLAQASPSIDSILRRLRPDMTGRTAGVTLSPEQVEMAKYNKMQELIASGVDQQSAINQAEQYGTGLTSKGNTVFEDQDLMVGKWRTMLEEGLTGVDIDAAITDYTSGGTSAGAVTLRNVMRDVLQAAKDEGKMDVGQIQDYLPTRLDEEAIGQRANEFLQDISPFVKDPQAALTNWMEQQAASKNTSVPKVDRAVKQDALGNWASSKQYQKGGDPETFRYKFSQGTVPPEFGHLEKARAFGAVPQRVLQKWTKEQSGSEVMSAVKDYLEGAAHRIAYAKEFGPGGEKLNFKIVKGIKEARKNGYNPSPQEIDQLYNIMDAYNNQHNPIQTEALRTVQSVSMAALTMKTLPLTLLSSLVETLNPAIRGDVKSAILEILPTFHQISKDLWRQVFKTTPRSEFSKLASEVNITLGASLNIAAERLGTNAFGRGSAKIMRGFFLANGLSLWTHMQSVYAAKVGDRIYRDNIYKLASGLPVTSAEGARLANQLRSMGVPVYTNKDAEILYNPLSLSQQEASRNYRKLAMRRFKDQTILQPSIADTPMWMSSGHLQWLAMLKRYPAAYGNIVLPALGRKFTPSWTGSRFNAFKGAASAMFIIGLVLMVGYIQDYAKMLAKGTAEADKRTEAQVAMDVFNSTLAPLQISLVTDFFAAPRYGTSGFEAVGGPVMGFTKETLMTIQSVADKPSEGEIWKYLFKQTPAAFNRPLREEVEDFDIFD